MNKTEIKKYINKSVYEFVTEMGYQISDDGDGSCVTFTKGGYSSPEESIDYHRSTHSTYVLNYASDEVKADAQKIDKYVVVVKADIEWKMALIEGDVE